MIYLEPPTLINGRRCSHLRADDPDELQAFAASARIKAKFAPSSTVQALGHYRLGRLDRHRAKRHGAIETSWSDTYSRLSLVLVEGTRRPAQSPSQRLRPRRHGVFRLAAASA